MKKIKFHISLITIIFLVLSFLLFGKTGNMLIDFSREAYIPYQMLNKEALSKDIFQIYGFWGYFINSFLYKISLNHKILLFEAHLLAYLSSIGFYLIAINYVKRNYAFIFTIFFISINIFSNSIFSFVMPYSYSMIWAVFSGIYMFYFLIKKNLNLVFLFLGLIFVNRLELFILFFITTIIYLCIKKINFLKNLPWVLLFPFLNLIYLITNKISLNDLVVNFNFIKLMSNTQAIKNLYEITGVFFSKKYFIQNIEELIIYILIFGISYIFYKKNYKISSVLFILLTMLLFNQDGHLYSLGAILLIILAIINFKKLNKKTLLLIVFSLILSSKALFNTSYLGYGNFGYIFILFSTFIVCSNFISKKYLILFITMLLISQNISNAMYYIKNPKTKTKTNGIYLTKDYTEIFNKTNDFIEKNIKKDENFIVIPEGQIFNYIHKKPWGFYNSTFTPLDFETFKDEQLINKLETNKTPYIIFFPRNTIDYGKISICYDYGVDFCTYVMDNYTRIAILEDNYKVLIFKRNEK